MPLGLMRALADAGDRASALSHARQHTAIVRRELDTDAAPSLRELVATLRTGPADPARPSSPLPSSPPTVADPAANDPVSTARPAVRGRWARSLAAVLLAVTAVAALSLVVLGSTRSQAIPVLAVGAIRTPELSDTSSLGPVLRDMLATSLGGLEGLQVVANSRLVELTPPGEENRPGVAAGAARRAGATEVIEGELSRERSGLVLTLRRVDLDRGVVRRGYTVRGEDRFALADSAAAQIALDLGLAPPSRTVRAVRTASPEAYALYTEGLRAFYSYDAPGALRLMAAALERDSTFAMAAYYAWQAGYSIEDAAVTQRAFERTKRLASHTIERERLLIQGQVARREAPIAAAAAIAETLTVRYPNDPDGHMMVGEVRHGLGEWPLAIAALERAVAIDSTAGADAGSYCRSCIAFSSMVEVYLWWDSAGAAERSAGRLRAIRPESPEGWLSAVEPLLRQGNRVEAERALEQSRMMGLLAVHWDAMLSRDLIRWGRLEEVEQKLRPALQAPGRETRGLAAWLLQLGLRDQGRLREARALALEGRIPGSEARVRAAIPEPVHSATMLQDLGRPDSAAKLLHLEAKRILAADGFTRGMQARLATWYLTLAGSAYAQAGDTASVRRLADSIAVLGRESTFGRDPLLHHHLRGLLLQRRGQHAEAVQEFRRALFSLTDGYTRINLALARSLIALGRHDEAIAVLRPAIHGGVDGSNSYTSRPELHEAMAQAFEKAGQRDSAIVHYQAVEQAWRHADPEFAERYRLAKMAGGR